MIQAVKLGWLHRSLAGLVDQVSLAGFFQAVLACSELSSWFRDALTEWLRRCPRRGTQPWCWSWWQFCAPGTLPCPPPCRCFCPQQHWWLCVILTNPRSSGNYTALFVHNRKDPRRFRVKWFFKLEVKLGINSLPVSSSGCKVWGSLQWQLHFVLEGSWTFGPQHISQVFITAANSCSFALDVYLKCVPQPLEWLSWDCLWGGSWTVWQPTGFCLEQPGWESRMRGKFAALRNSIHGHLLEEYQYFMCPVVHLSLVIHFTMH